MIWLGLVQLGESLVDAPHARGIVLIDRVWRENEDLGAQLLVGLEPLDTPRRRANQSNRIGFASLLS